MNKHKFDCSKRDRAGFAIVELLVIVVIIGALSILIVNYYSSKTEDGKNTITAPKEEANDASMRIDYTNAINQIKMFQAEYEQLPLANDCNPSPVEKTVCFKASAGNKVEYTFGINSDPSSFGLSITRKVDNKVYYIDKDSYPLIKSKE